MLWKQSWEPEAVLALIGGIVAAFFFGNISAGLLLHAGVSGFKSEASLGYVLVATLSFQGAVIVLGTVFLKKHGLDWRDVMGVAGWKRCLVLACAVLAVVTPVMFGLKYVSDLALEKMHLPAPDQTAVDMIMNAKPWVRAYLAFFAVVLAPAGEEIFFRGLLFSAARKFGWPKLGWFGVSFLFALSHANAPIFLSLFVLGLALTWLYQTTDGLLAPMLAHSLFNTGNLLLLLLAEKFHLAGP
jgi:membrane protease YdiL (CAAX protease family)